MDPDRCPACDSEVTAASARWCGQCGARLRPPAASEPVTPASRSGRRPVAPARATTDPPADDDTEAAGLRGTTGTLVQHGATVAPDDDPAAEVEAAPAPARIVRTRLLAAAVAVGAVAAVLALQPEPEVVHPAAGYAEGGGPARTGRVSHAPLETLPTETAWQVDLDIDALDVLSHVEVHDGVVIEHADRMIGRDPTTGSVRWVDPGRPTGHTRGVVVDGRYVQTSSSGTRAVDVETGRLVWQTDVEGTRVFALPAESAVVVQSQDTLVLLEAADGTRRWLRDLREGLPGVPSVGIFDVLVEDDGIIVSGSTPAGLAPAHPRSTPVVLSLGGRDGLVRWTRITEPKPEDISFPGVLHAGDLTALVEGDRITVLDDDGEPAGEPILRDVDGPVAMVAGGDTGPVLVLGNDRTVTGVDPVSGEVRWSATVPAEPGVEVTTRLDTRPAGTIIVTVGEVVSRRLRVHTIDPRDGTTTLALDLDDATFAAPWLDPDDRPAVVTGVGGGDRYRVTHLDTDVSWEAVPVTSVGGGPALRDGLVVAPTRIGGVAVELATGQVRWRADVGTPDARSPSLWATPALGETAVALGPERDTGPPRDRLAGYDLVSGVTAWSRADDSAPPRGRITLDGDRAFVPVGKEIHAYDLVTGRRAFAARSVEGITAVAVAGPHVIGTPGLDTHAPPFARQAIGIDRPTRGIRWRQDAPDACTAPTVALAGRSAPGQPATGPDRADAAPTLPDDGSAPVDLALWGTTTGVRAVDAFTGEVVWDDTTVGPVCHDLAVADDRVIANAASDDDTVDPSVAAGPATHRVVSFALASGQPGWTAVLPGPVVTAPVLAGDLAIVGLATGQLAAIAVATGEVVSVVDLDGVPAAPPAVSDDGEVVVLLTDGRLVAMR